MYNDARQVGSKSVVRAGLPNVKLSTLHVRSLPGTHPNTSADGVALVTTLKLCHRLNAAVVAVGRVDF